MTGIFRSGGLRIFLVDTSTYGYKSHLPGRAALEQRIKEVCQTRVRYGHWRVHVLLRHEGSWIKSAAAASSSRPPGTPSLDAQSGRSAHMFAPV